MKAAPQQSSDMRYFAKDNWLGRYLALRVIYKADAQTPSILKKFAPYLIPVVVQAAYYFLTR